MSGPRYCTRCRFRNVERPATFVAGDAEGLEWYECDAHEAEPTYPEGDTVRVVRTPIAEWFARAGLPVPGAS